jgi:DNA-binding NarL/FixJ family response regulator
MIHTCIIAASRYELLRSLKRTLEPDLEVVAMADNPVSLRDAVLALGPDLVVVNRDILGRDPGRIVSLLRSRSPEVGLILLSGEDDPPGENEARNAGVDLVVLRSRVGSGLVSAAEEVLDIRGASENTRQQTLKW